MEIQGAVGPAGITRPKHKRTFTGFGAGEIKSVEGELLPPPAIAFAVPSENSRNPVSATRVFSAWPDGLARGTSWADSTSMRDPPQESTPPELVADNP